MKRATLKFIKNFILKYSSVRGYLRFTRSILPFFKGRFLQVDVFLTLLNKEKKGDVSFIQIGASDGKTNDPIYPFVREFGWKGMLVEPLPNVFEQLKENYLGQPGLRFLNMAISTSPGSTNIFYIPQEYVVDEWQKQLASFDRRAIEFNLRNHADLIGRIATMNVPVQSLKWVVETSAFRSIDLMVLDVEGHEFQILKQLPTLQQKPTFIYYEKGTMKPEDLASLRKVLTTDGYELYNAGGDELAATP